MTAYMPSSGFATKSRRDRRKSQRRICETRCKAKSVFHFDIQGTVAQSTHAGIPCLLYLRRQCPDVHFWPFDGWSPATGYFVVDEAYPSPRRYAYPRADRTPDQHDASTIATGLQQADHAGTLAVLMSPHFQGMEEAVARVE